MLHVIKIRFFLQLQIHVILFKKNKIIIYRKETSKSQLKLLRS